MARCACISVSVLTDFSLIFSEPDRLEVRRRLSSMWCRLEGALLTGLAFKQCCEGNATNIDTVLLDMTNAFNNSEAGFWRHKAVGNAY